MKVGLTGATGFVGRALLPRIRAGGHHVVALARRTVPDADETRHCDLGASDADPGLCRGLDAVVHLAAYLPRSYADPAEASRCLQVNALGTLSLLLEAERAGVARFVFMSSGNAYRGGEAPAREDDLLFPSARAPYYLSSKLCAEIYVDHARAAGRLSSVILRPSAIYGAGMAGGMVKTFADRLGAGQPVELTGGGSYRVDLVHVDDVAAAAAAALAAKIEGPVNVGSGVASSARDVAECIRRRLGADPSLVTVAQGPGDQGFAPLDIALARRTLGYAPRSLENGIATMLPTRLAS